MNNISMANQLDNFRGQYSFQLTLIAQDNQNSLNLSSMLAYRKVHTSLIKPKNSLHLEIMMKQKLSFPQVLTQKIMYKIIRSQMTTRAVTITIPNRFPFLYPITIAQGIKREVKTVLHICQLLLILLDWKTFHRSRKQLGHINLTEDIKTLMFQLTKPPIKK